MISPEYRAVIDAVKKARAERDVSQRELARRLGKPASFVNKIEQLERRLDVLEFIAIAGALEIDAPELTRAVVRALPKKWSL